MLSSVNFPRKWIHWPITIRHLISDLLPIVERSVKAPIIKSFLIEFCITSDLGNPNNLENSSEQYTTGKSTIWALASKKPVSPAWADARLIRLSRKVFWGATRPRLPPGILPFEIHWQNDLFLEFLTTTVWYFLSCIFCVLETFFTLNFLHVDK